MDGNRFDQLTRVLARERSRRRVVGAFGGMVASGLLGALGLNRVSATDCADRCGRLPAGSGREQCLAACSAATEARATAAVEATQARATAVAAGDAARVEADVLRACEGDRGRLCGSGASVVCCAPDEVCGDGACGPGEGNPGPCTGVGKSCGGGDCCSGNCLDGQCVCSSSGGACQAAADCCNKNCQHGKCACVGAEASCVEDPDCCSGSCQQGQCVCNGIGLACTADGQCCDDLCVNGKCGCAQTGAACSGPGDCCSGQCLNGTCSCVTGSCPDPQVCFNHECCTPNCKLKQCGADDCGGTCGECPSDAICMTCSADSFPPWPGIPVCAVSVCTSDTLNVPCANPLSTCNCECAISTEGVPTCISGQLSNPALCKTSTECGPGRVCISVPGLGGACQLDCDQLTGS